MHSFECIFFNQNRGIFIQVCLMFAIDSTYNSTSTLDQLIAWRWANKLLPDYDQL